MGIAPLHPSYKCVLRPAVVGLLAQLAQLVRFDDAATLAGFQRQAPERAGQGDGFDAVQLARQDAREGRGKQFGEADFLTLTQ